VVSGLGRCLTERGLAGHNTFSKIVIMWHRKGLLIGILCNVIFIGKALPYLFLPVGTTVPSDSVAYSGNIFLVLFLLLFLVSIFGGLPASISDAFRNRGKPGNVLLSALAIFLCLSPFFTPYLLQKAVFDARQLRSHCIVCDGGEDSMPGYHFIPPGSKASYMFPYRYVLK
jgi:hypothetical protein